MKHENLNRCCEVGKLSWRPQQNLPSRRGPCTCIKRGGLQQVRQPELPMVGRGLYGGVDGRAEESQLRSRHKVFIVAEIMQLVYATLHERFKLIKAGAVELGPTES